MLFDYAKKTDISKDIWPGSDSHTFSNLNETEYLSNVAVAVTSSPSLGSLNIPKSFSETK